MLGTKTEAHVRSFFVNYRRRYNLDEIVGEYEAEHGVEPSKDKIDNDVELVRKIYNVLKVGIVDIAGLRSFYKSEVNVFDC